MNLRRWQCSFAWILLACAACRAEPPAAAPPSQPPGTLLSPEQAQALFRKCGEEVLRLPSFECEIAYDLQGVMDSGSRTARPSDRYRMVYAKPNLFRMEPLPNALGMTDSAIPRVFSADGRMSFHLPKQKRHALINAPENLIDFIHDAEVKQTLGKLGFALHYLGMAMPMPESGVAAKVTHLGDSEIDEVKVHVLEIRFAGANDDSDRFSLKVSVQSQPPHLPRLVEHERPSGMPREATEDLGVTMPFKRMVSTTRLDWRIDAELPTGSFAFVPAPDDVRVELADLFGARNGGGVQPNNHPRKSVGQPAPDFQLFNLSETPVTLKQHLGKDVVVLDFWATWCGPCIRAMPQLLEVAGRYRDRDVVVYAVNQKEKKQTIERFIKRKEWEIPILLDLDGGIGKQYGADAIPTTVIIDRAGVIRYWHQGMSDDLSEEMSSIIEKLLSE